MTPVREAGADDLPAMLALYRHLNDGDAVADHGKAGREWAALLGSDLITVLVAEADGVPAATCTLVVVPNLMRGARRWAVIENVVTRADQRRKGLGRAVMEEAIRRAVAADCYKIMLATGNPANIPFYESVGLRRTGKTFFEARLPPA